MEYRVKKVKEKKNKQDEQEYQIPEHVDYDLGADIIRTNKQKLIARRIAQISAFILIVFIIISFLGFTLGQYFASATTMSVNAKQPEIALAQVGFKFKNNKTPLDTNERARYSLQLDDNDPGLYWTGDTVSKEVISFILERDGYASNGKLYPVTARSFALSDGKEDLQLFEGIRNISNERHSVEENPANKEYYMDLSVYFRLLVQGDYSGQVALDNFGVYFTKDTKFSGNDDIKKALRVGVSSQSLVDIIGPGYDFKNETSSRAKINVGARLDLDGPKSGAGKHGYYDYTNEIFGDDGVTTSRYEIAYGDFEEEITDALWGEVNTVENEVPSNNSLYNAATYLNVRPLINATPKTQEYTAFSTYIREGEKGEAITYTNQYGVASFNLRIWIEGWDPNSSQQIANKTFGAQLKFEVYKKGLVS